MEWMKTLAAVAPTIATALGGPLAGVAINAVSSLLGIEPTEQALEATILKADPDMMLKLKQADNDFVIRMKELEIDIERIDANDRDSARKMRVDTSNIFTDVIAVAVIVGFFGVAYYVLSGGEIVDNVLAGTIIGYVSAKADQVLGFLFGSSRSSKDKTLAMSKLIK